MQAKEIGVLRSIGLRKGPLFRIYLCAGPATLVFALSLAPGNVLR